MTDEQRRKELISEAKEYEADHFANPEDDRFSSDVMADFVIAQTATITAERDAAVERVKDVEAYLIEADRRTVEFATLIVDGVDEMVRGFEALGLPIGDENKKLISEMREEIEQFKTIKFWH